VSVAKPSLGVELWGGILSEEPAPAVKKAVEAQLAAFDQDKDTLLDHLRKCKRGSESQHFDADKWWRRLVRLAQVYFLQQIMTPPSERVARLRNLAEVLGRARVLAKKAAQDDLGCDDLLSALFKGTRPRDSGGRIVRDEGGSLRVVYFAEVGLKQMVASLDLYRAAVLRAADDVPAMGPGKPAILPRNYIHALANVYRASTGVEPGSGRGPFLRFAMKFLAALDHSYKTRDENGDERVDDSLIEAIKAARREHGRL
jgi:hypothetical protein